MYNFKLYTLHKHEVTALSLIMSLTLTMCFDRQVLPPRAHQPVIQQFVSHGLNVSSG